MPIGLYNVAAVLKHDGYEVALLNLNAGGPSPEQAMASIEQFRPDVIGFSVLNANRWGGIEIARRAKALDAKIVTVFGGVGASYLWEHLLTHFAEIDYVVIGEGEHAFLDLVRSIERDAGARCGPAGRRCFPQGWATGKDGLRSFYRGSGPVAGSHAIFHLPAPLTDARVPGQLPFLRLARVLGPPGPVSLTRVFCRPDSTIGVPRGILFLFLRRHLHLTQKNGDCGLP